MNFVAKLIEFISPVHKALILGWNSPILSVRFDPKNHSKVTQKKVVRDKSKYKDLIYFSRVDLGFVYSHSEEAILWFDQNLNFYKFESKWVTGAFGKVFRKDKSEKNLFINTFYNEIEVYFGVGQGRQEKRLKIANIPGICISDFRALGSNKLLVATSDGVVIIYEFSEKRFDEIFKMKGRFGGDGYHTVCCNVSRDERYVAICSQRKLEMGVLKIFRISQDLMRLEELSSLDLRSDLEDSFMYYIKDVSLDLYLEGSPRPLILGFQYFSDYLLIPFILKHNEVGSPAVEGSGERDGVGLELIDDDGLQLPKRGFVNRICYYQNSLWCVDASGLVFRAGLKAGGGLSLSLDNLNSFSSDEF